MLLSEKESSGDSPCKQQVASLSTALCGFSGPPAARRPLGRQDRRAEVGSPTELKQPADTLNTGSVLLGTLSLVLQFHSTAHLRDFLFVGSKITAGGDYSHGIRRWLLPERKARINLDCILKRQRHPSANKCLSSQSYGFSSSHVRM